MAEWHGWLLLRSLIRDSRVQSRESINATIVTEYAQEMAKRPALVEAGLEPIDFPPIDVFCEQRGENEPEIYWLADGWHRVLAAEEAGRDQILARIRDGGVHEAIMHAAGANARHGLRRSNRDKVRAVRMLLDHPTVIREEWGNARIAFQAGVSTFCVRTTRRAREQELGLPESTERRGGDGKLYSLQRKAAPDGPKQPVAAPGASETTIVGVDPAASNGDRSVSIYGCDRCDAVTTEPCWHCVTCDSHLPIQDYPSGVECPVCVDDPLATTSPILARLEDVEAPKPHANGRTQAPYTPGIMRAGGAVLAHERLLTAINLIDTLTELDPSELVAEAVDRPRFMARLRGAWKILNTLVEAWDAVGV